MRLYRPVPLSQVLKRLPEAGQSFEVVGDIHRQVFGLNDYQVALPDDIIWVDFAPLHRKAFKTDASVIIIDSLPDSYPEEKTLVITDNPRGLFDRLAYSLYDAQFPPRSFLSRCLNPKDRQIGKHCRIDRSVKLGKHVSIGDNVTIEPYVVIHDNVIIGDNVTIGSHCVIGGPPFSHTKLPDGCYEARKSWGNTIILDGVDLASMTNIDRGITGSTIIGAGTKTCAICQIGHDTWLGSNCYLCSGVTIAGYVRIGNNCQFWGQAGVSSSVIIADDTCVEACGIVLKDVRQPGQNLAGFPAEPKQAYWKRIAKLKMMASEYGE